MVVVLVVELLPLRIGYPSIENGNGEMTMVKLMHELKVEEIYQ